MTSICQFRELLKESERGVGCVRERPRAQTNNRRVTFAKEDQWNRKRHSRRGISRRPILQAAYGESVRGVLELGVSIGAALWTPCRRNTEFVVCDPATRTLLLLQKCSLPLSLFQRARGFIVIPESFFCEAKRTLGAHCRPRVRASGISGNS